LLVEVKLREKGREILRVSTRNSIFQVRTEVETKRNKAEKEKRSGIEIKLNNFMGRLLVFLRVDHMK
jgi:hypothetical protein